jgi:hypothetical protein
MDTPERRVWGESRPKDRVIVQIILVFTLTLPKTLTQGHVSVCDKYFTLASCKCIEKYRHCNRISVSMIKFGRVIVNDLHLHWIYTPYIWLMTLTRTTLLVQTNVGRCLLL